MEDSVKLTKWVLGVTLAVAPMYAQQASTDQQAPPQPPAAANQGSAQGTTSDANA